MGFEQYVVDIVVVVVVVVVGVFYFGIQQCYVQVVVGGFVEECLVEFFLVVVVGMFDGGVDFVGEFFWNCLGYEVDYFVDVLWVVVY